MVFTCAYVVCWGYRVGLAIGTVFRCLGLGDRVGLGGTASGGGGCEVLNLEAGILPACRPCEDCSGTIVLWYCKPE